MVTAPSSDIATESVRVYLGTTMSAAESLLRHGNQPPKIETPPRITETYIVQSTHLYYVQQSVEFECAGTCVMVQ